MYSHEGIPFKNIIKTYIHGRQLVTDDYKIFKFRHNFHYGTVLLYAKFDNDIFF